MNPGVLAQFHENEALVTAVQSRSGRLALWLIATLLFTWHEVTVLMPAALALVMVFPAQRRILLSVAAAGTLAERFLDIAGMQWMFLTGGVVAGLACLYIAYILVLRFPLWPAAARRYPLLTLHTGIWIALLLSTIPWLGVLAMVPFLAWRLSYLVMQGSRGKVAGTRFRDHLFYLVPVFGGTQTPYGKGLDYLTRHEARDPGAFARSQLAGIKLLLLAILWIYVREFMDAAVFGHTVERLTAWPQGWTLGLSRLAEYLQSGVYPAWHIGWGTIYLELIRATLSLAAVGHVIVGCLRLLGFNVFRNTYKPLLSESVLEFWNRYYYYFKELLVEFFFYPTYLRLRALSPSSRMFAAVFAAAFLGNMYHHILSRPDTVIHSDFAGFWSVWGPRFIYCFLLALGIGVSMLRQQKMRKSGSESSPLIRVRRMAGVWTFYAIIHIWNVRLENVGIADCMRFFLSLLGI